MEPGDLIICEHPYLYDSFIVARVAKVGKVMWEIEHLRGTGTFETPVRRRVVGARKVPKDRDPVELVKRLNDLVDNHRRAVRDLTDKFRSEVYSLASENI